MPGLLCDDLIIRNGLYFILAYYNDYSVIEFMCYLPFIPVIVAKANYYQKAWRFGLVESINHTKNLQSSIEALQTWPCLNPNQTDTCIKIDFVHITKFFQTKKAINIIPKLLDIICSVLILNCKVQIALNAINKNFTQ